MTSTTPSNIAPKPEHVPPELVYDFDLARDPRILTNPHLGMLAIQQEAGDIFWTPCNGGHWVFTRSDMVFDALQDWQTFSSVGGLIPAYPEPEGGYVSRQIPIDTDPPQHGGVKRLLATIFSPKNMLALEDEVRVSASRLVDAVVDKGRCEFITDISEQLPVRVFMDLMGMPSERYKELRTWVYEFFHAESTEHAQGVISRMESFMRTLIEERVKSPKNDVITRLMNSEVDGQPIKLDTVNGICTLLFIAGLHTVTDTMGYTAFGLAMEPSIQRELRKDLSLVPQMIEEMMRRYAIANTLRRVNKSEIIFHGVPMRRNDRVWLWLSLAGMDARKIENPTKVDIHRADIVHLGFSAGIHRCVGSHLARLELRVLFEEVFKRLPEFRVADDDGVKFRGGLVFSIAKVPLQWDVAQVVRTA